MLYDTKDTTWDYAELHSTIANIYDATLFDKQKAISHYRKSVLINEQIKDYYGLRSCVPRLMMVYMDLEKADSATFLLSMEFEITSR